MVTSGPQAKWETKDGYLTYFLHFSENKWILMKQDHNAKIRTTNTILKAWSVAEAMEESEKIIKPKKNGLTEV
jgi:hypothetical protein